MRQDEILYSDWQRLAAPEAARSGYFRKLRAVEIVGGEIRGEWAEITDSEGYWNPFSAYYEGKMRPYLALANCGRDPASIKRFFENHGSIGQNLSGAPTRTGSFSLAKFRADAWRFHFALALIGSSGKPELLRKVLLASLDDVWGAYKEIKRDTEMQKRALQQGKHNAIVQRFQETATPWWNLILDLGSAAGIHFSNNRHAAQAESDYQKIRKQLESLTVSEKRTARAHLVLGEEVPISVARKYLAMEFCGRLKDVFLCLKFPDGEHPRLIAECRDLLAAFYWMLAKDWDSDRAPRVCANCREFFGSKRKGVVYCDSEKCKGQGRRSLDWARNKEKYNRNRKLKRLKAQRAASKAKSRRRA